MKLLIFLTFLMIYSGTFTVKHFVYAALSTIALWPLKKAWDWWKHCFWIGFVAVWKAQAKKGSPLTEEEKAAVLEECRVKIKTELNEVGIPTE